MIKRIVLICFFLLGLIYLIVPGPTSINNILPLPDSKKSAEPGDSIQVPNIAAYFSDNRRQAVTAFYREQFSYINILGFKIPALRFNHPPEDAYTYIRDQQPSTYLEEYSYPLRDSIYVNGFEPFDLNGKPYRRGATLILIDSRYYISKTTLRYYGSNVFLRVFIYLLIWFSLWALFRLYKKILINK